MPESEPKPGTQLEYLYKEYVRLSERCASYVQSSFDDIKLYGASSLVFAWKPIAESGLISSANKSLTLLLGFLAILILVIMLAIFNLLKQSLVIYYLRHLRAYEAMLRADLGLADEMVFHWSESYSKWRKKVVEKVFVHLLVVLSLIVILFPIVFLWRQGPHRFAVIYGLASVLLVGIYLSAARILLLEQ